MDFDAEDVEELDAALVGVSWSDIHLLKRNPLVERRVSTNPSGRDRERPAIPDDLRRRRGRHCHRPRTRGFAAGYRVHADLCQRSDKPGQLDLVAQPRVRQQHHGLRPRGEGARRALPHADARRHQGPARPGWGRRLASGQHRTDRPAPGEQDHGDRPGEGRRSLARSAVFQHRAGGEHLLGEHSAGHPRRGPRSE